MSAVLAQIFQIAHDTGVFHEEPFGAPPKGNSGGASAIVIFVGVALSIAAVAALYWLKRRTED